MRQNFNIASPKYTFNQALVLQETKISYYKLSSVKLTNA